MKNKLWTHLFSGLSVLCMLAALWVCVQGPAAPVTLIGASEPDAAADTFLAALNGGDYAALSALCLTPLPAEELPEDADAAALYELLRSSWNGEFTGDAVREGNTALFPMHFETVDVSALCSGLEEDVNTLLAEYVDSAALASEVFGEDGSYRDEVVLRAWNEAYSARLARGRDYLYGQELTLELRYIDHRWQVVPANEWLIAMGGGV